MPNLFIFSLNFHFNETQKEFITKIESYLHQHRPNSNQYFVQWSVIQFQHQSTDYHLDGPTLILFYLHIQQYGNLYVYKTKRKTEPNKSKSHYAR